MTKKQIHWGLLFAEKLRKKKKQTIDIHYLYPQVLSSRAFLQSCTTHVAVQSGAKEVPD